MIESVSNGEFPSGEDEYPRYTWGQIKLDARALLNEYKEAKDDAAKRAETRGWADSQKVMEETTKRLADQGMKVEPPSAAMRAELDKIGETMIAEWTKRAGADGQAMLKAYRGN